LQAKNVTKQPFESANVIISAGENELLEFDIRNKRINVDVENKEFLKGLIKIGRDFTKKQNGGKKESKKSPSALKTAKTVAEALKKNGITITLSYKGKVVATLGEAAHSTLLQLITKTNAIAINSLPKAISMII
jgi:hypothetical protein